MRTNEKEARERETESDESVRVCTMSNERQGGGRGGGAASQGNERKETNERKRRLQVP